MNISFAKSMEDSHQWNNLLFLVLKMIDCKVSAFNPLHDKDVLIRNGKTVAIYMGSEEDEGKAIITIPVGCDPVEAIVNAFANIDIDGSISQDTSNRVYRGLLKELSDFKYVNDNGKNERL